MKNFFKGKITTVAILLATFILAGVAIFTAIRLYQLRQQPVAPNVPSSQPEAAGNCSLTFTITRAPTPTPTRTPTPTPTRTPTLPPITLVCGQACVSTATTGPKCKSGLTCNTSYPPTCTGPSCPLGPQPDGSCRNPSCPAQINCICGPTPTPTRTPTPTPTRTPTPTPTASPSTYQCYGIKTYDAEWNLITDFSKIKPGHTLNFTVKGSATGFDKAQFKINGTEYSITTSSKPGTPGEFYQAYTLPAQCTGVSISVSVQAKIHHPVAGWSNY